MGGRPDPRRTRRWGEQVCATCIVVPQPHEANSLTFASSRLPAGDLLVQLADHVAQPVGSASAGAMWLSARLAYWMSFWRAITCQIDPGFRPGLVARR